jgi:hypothetical protein
MKVFLKKLTIRAGFILILLVIIFSIQLPSSYYLSIPEGSVYSKIPWDFRQIDAKRIDESTRLFIGSSLCETGINDSLMEAIDTSSAQFLNFGVSHGCNAISTFILRKTIAEGGNRPHKVYLCLKSDSRPTGIHRMYGVIADRSEILGTIPFRNIRFMECFFKRFSWNINSLTGVYKMNTHDSNMIHHSNYGQVQMDHNESRDIAKLHKTKIPQMQELARFMKASKGRHEPGGFMRKLSNWKMDYLDNMYFQDEKFLESTKILGEAGVDYDIILYPNYTAVQLNEEQSIIDFYKQLYADIDFNQHQIICVHSDSLKNPLLWQDLNHFNNEGSAVYSRLLLPLLAD